MIPNIVDISLIISPGFLAITTPSIANIIDVIIDTIPDFLKNSFILLSSIINNVYIPYLLTLIFFAHHLLYYLVFF